MIISDSDGGHRRFLGADPESALRLEKLCSSHAVLDQSFVISAGVAELSSRLVKKIAPTLHISHLDSSIDPGIENRAGGDALIFPPPDRSPRFYPQMLDWVTNEIERLVNQDGVAPGEIAVLAPYLSDALRFSLHTRLDEHQIPWRTHRPSRSLRDEPATTCLLTLAALAHPGWKRPLTKFELAYALLFAIEGMDLVRAQLLAEIVFRPRDLSLSSFEQIRSEIQERITFLLGERYTRLRDWLLARKQENPVPLDHFLRRLFGEVLSQPGYGFHRNQDAARVAGSLVESIKKFRQVMPSFEAEAGWLELGKEYLQMLDDGVIAAQYIETWQAEEKEGVLIAPAYTFLMMNRPVTIQFWLDVGASGWWERLSQPLTQPYVLSRAWMQRGEGSLWRDADEVAANQQTLAMLITGLLRRCRERVYLGLSDLGESGYEQRGPLLKAIWKMQVQGTESWSQ